MQVRYSRKLSMRIIGRMNDLSWSNYETADNNGTFITFYDEDNNPVGVILIKFDGFTLVGEIPAFNIFIGKFEVNPQRRGEGWAKLMIDWLTTKYNIGKITLHHVEPAYDDGASKNFWMHMGFHRTKNKNELVKSFIG